MGGGIGGGGGIRGRGRLCSNHQTYSQKLIEKSTII